MSHNHSPDDSPLTAYLLGELAPAEVAQLEEQLAASSALREELDALRGTVAALQSAFAQQSAALPAVPAINREKLHSLLRSAVVTPAIEASTAAPLLLASGSSSHAPRPARGRGLMVGGAVAMLLGLVVVSQFEPGPESVARNSVAQRGGSESSLRSDLTRGLAVNDVDATGPVDQVEEFAVLAKQLPGVQPLAEELYRQPATQGVARRHKGGKKGALPAGRAKDAAMDAGLVQDRDEFRRKNLTQLGPQSATPSRPALLAPVTVAANGTLPAGTPPLATGGANLGFGFRGITPQPQGSFAGRLPSSDDFDFYKYNHIGVFFADPSLAAGTNAAAFSKGMNHWSSRPGLGLEGMRSDDVGFDSQPDGKRLYARSPVTDFGREVVGLQLGRGLNIVHSSLMPQVHLHDSLSSLGDTDREMVVQEAKGLPGRYGLDVDANGDGISNEMGSYAYIKNEGDIKPSFAGEAAGVPAPSSEVAQLRFAVDNLQRLVTSNDNGRGTSLDLSSNLSDLSGRLGEQQESLKQIELSVAQRSLADGEPESKVRVVESAPAAGGKPAATELALVEQEAGERVSEQTLALAKAREEVQRAYTAWYYREGRIRQAREVIAAAESYAHVPENDFVTPDAQPLSTFGIDVDSASYANVRRFVESNQLPPPDAVRIEELVNSFKYDGPTVAEGEAPLALAAEVGICPWQPQHQLLRVALKGKSIDLEKRPAARLVFLVDTSGSMSDENKLPLVKQSLRLLVEQMREQDRLSIVTYSDNAGLLLDSTGGDKRAEILAKIDALVSDGSTNGEAGLKLAYEVAVKQFAEGATNRVMLCTDGDFNVGESSDSAMVKLIEKERQTGVFLNIFGFGSGNLKDSKLEAIADKGNGQYIYIDGIKEARKTLLNELTGTLYTIAKDVKLQIEFNPALVGSYRLVGYENRVMAAQDFANDKVDSGDLGAGHSVVALYEIIPPGAVAPAPKPEVEQLKYKRAGSVGQTILSAPSPVPPAPAKTSEVSEDLGSLPPAAATPAEETPAPPVDAVKSAPPADPLASELCTIRLRYKQPTSNESTKIETTVIDQRFLLGTQLPLTKDYLWATAVAEFGLVLRHSSFVGSGNFSQVLELAQSAIGDDPTGQRREFLTLVRQTQHLEHQREAQIAELSKMVREDEQLVHRRDEAAKNAELMAKASCSGKYKTLLRQLEVPTDQANYGDFKDYGRWDETEYQSFKNLPPGYWVYAAPHWYIWNESTEQAAVTPK